MENRSPIGTIGRGFSIITDSLHRAACKSLLTRASFFVRLWLPENEGIIVLVRTGEVFRSGVAANIAIDTRRVNIVTARYILLHAIVSIRHKNIADCRLPIAESIG
jgi:hypothetical protein